LEARTRPGVRRLCFLARQGQHTLFYPGCSSDHVSLCYVSSYFILSNPHIVNVSDCCLRCAFLQHRGLYFKSREHHCPKRPAAEFQPQYLFGGSGQAPAVGNSLFWVSTSWGGGQTASLADFHPKISTAGLSDGGEPKISSPTFWASLTSSCEGSYRLGARLVRIFLVQGQNEIA